MMAFDEYRFLYPPRPDQAIPPTLIGMYDGMGWWPQVKKNGTCCVIGARGDEVIFQGRHDGNDLAAWSPLPEHKAFFAGSEKWEVYVAELLHSKVPGIRNELYIFDLIVSGGEHLTGTTLSQRALMLRERFGADGKESAGLGALRIAPFIQLADALPRGEAAKLWRGDCLQPEDEGFVFKNPRAPLVACLTATANSSWQVKCRRPTKNYSY